MKMLNVAGTLQSINVDSDSSGSLEYIKRSGKSQRNEKR